jgi:DnaJ-class molecular chaperone
MEDLEEKCPACQGSGRDMNKKDNPFCCCPRCYGTGYVPNENGLKVLTLLRHNKYYLESLLEE